MKDQNVEDVINRQNKVNDQLTVLNKQATPRKVQELAYRIEKNVDCESTQKSCYLKVTFPSAEKRNAILGNSFKLIGYGIYVGEDLSLVDCIRRSEVDGCRRDGERNLVLKRFQIAKRRSQTIPKPLQVVRESFAQNWKRATQMLATY